MYGLAFIARRGTAVSAVLLAAIVAAVLIAASPPEAHADEPVITHQYPEEGDVVLEPLRVIQMCFAEPVDVRDLPPLDEGEFEFGMERPDGLGVGMRIVFQGNGYGVAIYPGTVDEGAEGSWELTVQVRDAETLERLEHSISWEVQSGGEPIVTPTPVACPSADDPSPAATGGSDRTPGPTDEPNGNGSVDDDGSDVDVLELALLTIGAAGGAGVLLLIGFLIRRRVGFWMHRPPDDDESSDDQH